MRAIRIAGITVVTAALLAAPLSAAQAAKPAPSAKARFVVSKLLIVGSPRPLDVSKKSATVRFTVQVKDFDKVANPSSVKASVVRKGTGATQTFVLTTRRVGRSHVVSSWLGSFVVPRASAAGTYCLAVVYVDDKDPRTPTVTASAKKLPGRDCVVVS